VYYTYRSLVVDKEKAITVAIIIGLFGGLIGGPVTSLIYYDAAPEERFYLFIIPEIIGFICAGLMVYFGKLKKKSKV
ncbi:MAG: hypothetical protein ACRD8W_26115, partial [Nitrososphaeraceae archaeon]